MIRQGMALMIACLLGFFLPVLSLAGTEDAGLVGETPLLLVTEEEVYLIGPGDVLNISVWKDESLTCSCVVRPDGALSFPLIGDMHAAGKSAEQIKAELEKKLDWYVPDVILSVEVKEINSMIIYVIGKVNAPGRYVMNTNVDVLQTLATAGGLNIYAKRNKIKILRQEKDKTTIFPFEYDKIVEGSRLEENIRLKRGDVLVVP